MKDRNDLEWEVTELSKEVSRLRDWKYNLESQFLLYEKEDENGELKRIGVEIEKLSNRVKYLSGLLLSAELPEEKDKKTGKHRQRNRKHNSTSKKALYRERHCAILSKAFSYSPHFPGRRQP